MLTSWSASDGENGSVAQQLDALGVALEIGRLLNRVVILPRFHCLSSKNVMFFDCPLNSLIEITTFDSKFSSSYRENSFLRNPKVPKSVSRSVTSRLDVVPIEPNYQQQVVTSDELMNQFKPVAERVLSLGLLYNVRVKFPAHINDVLSVRSAVEIGFRLSDYSQYSLLVKK